MYLEIPGPWSRCLLPRWWEFAHSRHGPCSRRRSLQSCPRCPSEKKCVIKCVMLPCGNPKRARQTCSMVPRRHVFWACWNRVFDEQCDSLRASSRKIAQKYFFNIKIIFILTFWYIFFKDGNLNFAAFLSHLPFLLSPSPKPQLFQLIRHIISFKLPFF